MLRIALIIASLLSVGCNAHVFSPPTGSFPVESSQTIGLGKRAVSGDAFRGGALFGPELMSLRASYRQGVHDKLELSAAPALTRVLGSRAGDSHPNVYALRVGAKYALVRHFAVIGGAGGGGSAAGAFLSPDLGVIAAFENPYFVPFVSVRALLSAPLNPRRVHFTTGDDASDGVHDSDGEDDSYELAPKLTFGYQVSLGARLPLTHGQERADASVLCAAGITTLNDASNDQGYGGLACAVDVIF